MSVVHGIIGIHDLRAKKFLRLCCVATMLYKVGFCSRSSEPLSDKPFIRMRKVLMSIYKRTYRS